MHIVDFTAAHIEQAVQIAKHNYEEARGFIPALPTEGSICRATWRVAQRFSTAG
jgi:hypothetical protein